MRVRSAGIFLCAFLAFLAGLIFLTHGRTIALLQPQGTIAASERALMFHAVLLMLIVIVPVYILAAFFAWQYRASNTKAKYEPQWEHSRMDELVWWAIPFEIILVLGALTWTSTHELDPHRPIASAQSPLVIEVIALPWKWLFIYPAQHIASVNFVEIPTAQPVEFQITADAPMNSFWIPQLGGQVYAMDGMVNPLYLEADRAGDYRGFSANYSGDGFAGMQFIARAANGSDFAAWVASAQSSPLALNAQTYSVLTQPSQNNPVTLYGSVDPALYNQTVMKFMSPFGSTHH